MATTAKLLIAGVLTTIALMAAPVSAHDLTHVAFVQTAEKNSSIPVGHLEFCKSRPDECRANPSPIAAMPLDAVRWEQLVAVNSYYNQTVVPVEDRDLYQVDEFWTYPNGYGDCEDFALAKRRDLIEAGWNPSTLMIAVVREPNGNGHAVLMARTDRGDMVLDNQDGTIKLWSDTPYTFLKRQSQTHSGHWVDMIDERVVVVAANY
jgi:predicted transglutaminase-like cysteine proteinase